MIVDTNNWDEVLRDIRTSSQLSLDTETTGLFPFLGDRLFSIIIANATQEYYFNFLTYPDADIPVLSRDLIPEISKACGWSDIFMANAKFDMHMLAMEEADLDEVNVIDVLVVDRLLYNDHMSYSLAAVAERHGYEKDDAVEEHIKEEHLWEWVDIPGKKIRSKNKFYDRVPFEIMHPYGERDARITYDVGVKQDQLIPAPLTSPRYEGISIYEVEEQITVVCYHMEKKGILVDQGICKVRAQKLTAQYKELTNKFQYETGNVFVDSGKGLAKAFTACGVDYPRTKLGNPSFTEEVLALIDNPVANMVKEIRHAYKMANTYYRSFMYFSDEGGVVHGNFRQAGTKSGRFSFSNPNLQNVPKGEVRESFVPRPDYCYVMIDYDQMEFRLMLDYAGEMDLIEQINNGLDPHTATAEITGLERSPAKTLNFALLYGMGIKSLAHTLKVDTDTAFDFRETYFDKLPKVSSFLNQVKRNAWSNKYLYSWAGRIFQYPNMKMIYKAPNSLIQGGCADIVKIAMVECDEYLMSKRSNMLLQVHDELVFEVHKDELEIVDDLKNIMENVYPYKHLKLTCSVEHSWLSWGQPVEGAPICGIK